MSIGFALFIVSSYSEHVNRDPQALRAIGKYVVGRLTDHARDAKPIALLPAA